MIVFETQEGTRNRTQHLHKKRSAVFMSADHWTVSVVLLPSFVELGLCRFLHVGQTYTWSTAAAGFLASCQTHIKMHH